MKKDFNTSILMLVFGMPLLFIAFIAGLYFIPCGLGNDCSNATLPDVIHTPIPTIIPATMVVPPVAAADMQGGKCVVDAETLLSSWVNAKYPEKDPFSFTDQNSTPCQATYADVSVLFKESNLWYNGAPACITCHNSNIAAASAQMDLSSYAGITAGARRATADAKGQDILGGGVWASSSLNDWVFVQQKMPLGRPAGAVAPHGPTLMTGTQVLGKVPPSSASSMGIARPSNPGGEGPALKLMGSVSAGAAVFTANCVSCHGEEGKGGVPNPGSTDGTVPALNPIDPTLVDADPATFAYNLDLFLEHGSTPAGPNPALRMPAWGDSGALTPQQIADVLAYLIGLNQ